MGDRRRTRSPTRSGMGNRINTVMQPCFFQLSGVLPADEAIAAHQGVRRARLRRVGAAASSTATSPPSTQRWPELHRVRGADRGRRRPADGASMVPADAPDFVSQVTAVLLAGDGDLLPVERPPRRRHLPQRHRAVREAGDRRGDPDLGPGHLHRLRQVRHRLPARHHPHEGVRARHGGRRRPDELRSASRSAPRTSPGHLLTIQVAPDDCTGCGVCVDVCPAKSKTEIGHKAINMEPVLEHRDRRAVDAGTASSPSRPSTARSCPTTRSRAPRCSSRCSSSPGPAPGAARRRTSSSSPSSSATA